MPTGKQEEGNIAGISGKQGIDGRLGEPGEKTWELRHLRHSHEIGGQRENAAKTQREHAENHAGALSGSQVR